MKKFVSLLLAALMLASMMAGCGAKSDSAAKVKTVTPGTLTVATSPDFAPWSSPTPPNRARICTSAST